MGMEVEAVLEKIWDLHDKLSDAIHSISRTHFLNSIKSLRKSNDLFSDMNQNHRPGFVFVKDFRLNDDEAIQEAKSLNAIRTALENLEDHLEFFHTVQTQQRAERDAATARLEQSRIVLAMRLAKHEGKKYEVIDEARAFVGDLSDAGRFASPQTSDNFVPQEEKRSNFLIRFLISSFNFAKNQLKSDNTGGILGNAALFALSMVALLQLHQVTCKDKYILDFPQRQEDIVHNRNGAKFSRPMGSSSGSTHLDVLLARG